MGTTGIADFNPDFLDIAEEAWERASGGATELRSGYHLRTVRRSLNLLLTEWANQGLNLWTLEEGVLPLTEGDYRFSLPDDTVDLMEYRIKDTTIPGGSAPLQRISVSEYSTRQLQDIKGRPTSIATDRKVGAPDVLVWPVPEKDGYEIHYWRIRRIQNVGDGQNTQDVPFRFVPAMIAGLAYKLAMKIPEGAARVALLKSEYIESWLLAAEEDRDKSSVRLVPRVAGW